jgi:AcrR family transcriptional regulator
MAESKPAASARRSERSAARYSARRDEVIDIAARVFAERGYHATSIDDLVEATGLQRGGLYHYIGGKKDLLIRIHERFIDPLLADARAIVEAGDPSEPTLRKLAAALMHDISEYGHQVTVFLHEWRLIENGEEWSAIREARREFEQLIATVLERGENDGSFVIEDRRMTVLAFLGMFNYSYQWYRSDGRMTSNDLAELFCDIFLGGIKA